MNSKYNLSDEYLTFNKSNKILKILKFKNFNFYFEL